MPFFITGINEAKGLEVAETLTLIAGLTASFSALFLITGLTGKGSALRVCDSTHSAIEVVLACAAVLSD